MDPCIITAHMLGTIAGEAPMLDALLERHAFVHDIDGCASLSAGRQLNTHDPLTYDMLDCVPLARHTFSGGEMCYCVSSPIVDCVHDGTDHFVRRVDFTALKDRVLEKEVAKLRQVTGPYAPSFEPHRVRAVRAIAWMAIGDIERLSAWLGEIKHIGGKTGAGYGAVASWSVEHSELGKGWMIHEGVLMRPVPDSEFKSAPKGGRPYYGAIKPPYWHPMRQMEIWKPC